MTEDRRITKIRFAARKADESVELEYEEKKGKAIVTSGLKSPEAPEPEFVSTLRGLKGEFLRILELPASYGEGLEVHQVAISYPRDRRGVVIGAKKKLAESNSPLVIHTPWLPEPADTESGAGGGMSSIMIESINLLEKLAEAYLEGARAQQELTLDAADAAVDTAPANGNGGGRRRRKLQQADIEEEAKNTPAPEPMPV